VSSEVAMPSSTTATVLIGLLALLAVFFLSGCVSRRGIPAKGQLHAYSLTTTVDDESARYYLEDYLPRTGHDEARQQRIDSLHAQLQDAVPSREQLRQISTALVFANQLLKQPGNAPLQTQFLANLAKVQDGTIAYPRSDVLIMFVPGYDYVANGRRTGADFARPRKLLAEAGYDVLFVTIDPQGSVEENAAYLARTLLAHRQRRIALAGASSAGPAIHLALGKLIQPADLANVKAWLNLGGILQGSPVLDQFASGPKGWLFSTVLWAKGWPRASFASMSVAASRARFATLTVPGHIAIYNYLGLSLSGNISGFARDKYWMMRKDGPNDGLTLLPDIVAPHSLSILSPTTDHFFAEDPEIDRKTLALLVTIIERLAD
jgi:hypothetical protein